MKKSDLDGCSKLFGWRFHEGGSNGLVTIYIEDDETYFPKLTCDRFWIEDLLFAAAEMFVQSNRLSC